MDPERNTLIREGIPSIVNPFDAYALELALSIKDSNPETEIITLCMGPPQAEKSLRETLAMGADKAILISDVVFSGSDTWATSYTLAGVIRQIENVDLVFTGKQAIDGDTAQVGPGLADFLEWPQGIFVRSIKNIDDGSIEVERLTDYGSDILKLDFPALISVVKLPKEPRLPSLRGMMKAKKAKIQILTNSDLGLEEFSIGLFGSPTRVVKIFTPQSKEKGEKWEGEPVEMAEKLISEIKNRNLL